MEMDNGTIKLYLYRNMVVKATGRVAQKHRYGDVYDLLIEVTPASEIDGTWTRFISQRQLAEINET